MKQSEPTARVRRGYTVSPIVWIVLVLAIVVYGGFWIYMHKITTPKEDPSKPVPLAPQASTEPDTEPSTDNTTEPAEPTTRSSRSGRAAPGGN